VSGRGSPHGRFRGAVDRGNLLDAEACARELGHLELADALDLLLLIAAKEPARFPRAAARWHARFVVEVQGLHVADSQLLLGAVAGLADIAPRVSLETVAPVAGRFRADALAGSEAAARRLAAGPYCGSWSPSTSSFHGR
jgi:hypothetical protein